MKTGRIDLDFQPAELPSSSVPEAASSPRAPMLIVTGFLGSGKTTLLNHLIGRLAEGGMAGAAFGVIVNDFGPVAVDRDLVLGANSGLLQGEEEAVLEVAGGSIFCSCLESVFVDGLAYYARRRPQLLLVETSGLSDPSTIRRVLSLDEAVAAAFRIGAIVCVLDATEALDLLEVTEAARRQVRAGSLLVVNKTDLVDRSTCTRLRAVLESLNPAARIVETTHGRVDLSLLEETPSAPLAGEEASSNTPQARPSSLLVDQRELSMEALRGFLEAIEGRVLRLKGFYAVEGTTWYVEDDHDGIHLARYEGPVSTYGLSVLCSPEERGRVYEAWQQAVGQA